MAEVNFDKESMEKTIEAVEYYEANRKKILAYTKKAVKYAKELQEVFLTELGE